MWAFVQYRYQPRGLMPRLEEAVCQPGLAAQLRGSDWASLIWGFASLGAEMTPSAAAVVSERGSEFVESMNSSELCNLLW